MFKIREKNYKRMIGFFQRNEYCRFTLEVIYKLLPPVLFIAYPALVAYVFFSRPSDIFKIILVPLCVFLLVTVSRKLINEQRPYEKYNTPSLFGKTTKGQSMPSRHTASAFIISIAILYVSFDLGVTALSISVLIAISRILAGVHYIRDVLTAIVISVAAGVTFFFII